MYEFTGTVSEICPVQTFASGFSKRELLVKEEAEQFPRVIVFNFKKENAEKLASLAPGDRVRVHFALDGRNWTDPRTGKVRHFCDLIGVSVDMLSSARRQVPDSSAREEEEVMPF